ncbi:hypothetical protein CFC21_106433 [Triticum aestivum]|uniref:Uncharacterized protein n=2 Tax=Triticum aestivum TaxID=4565 RepID=A0A3B6TB71_WHEAT|nr:hypothetical protein CFC21_106433 [Triticum aestivum]
MADLVPLNNNPYNGGGDDEAVAVEPEERSRLMLICAVGLYYVAIRGFSQLLLAGGFRRHVITSGDLTLWAALLDLAGSLVYLAASLLALVSLVPALWLVLVWAALVAEWLHGNPEGRRLADDLLQSDRWLFHEPFYRVLCRLFPY